MRTIEDAAERVRAHYLEMPGELLSAEEIQRLCGIEPAVCQLVLDTLVNEHFLCVKWDLRYVRVTEECIARSQSQPDADFRPVLDHQLERT